MFAIVKNGQIEQICGNENVRLCDTVFQPLGTLSAEQKAQFGVVPVQVEIPTIDESRYYLSDKCFTVEDGYVKESRNVVRFTLANYQAMREGAVERGLTDRVAEIDALISEIS